MSSVECATYSVAEAAQRLGVSKGYAYDLIKRGEFPALVRTVGTRLVVVRADLERSGLFKPIDPAAHIQSPEQLRNAAPRFVDWRQINAQALVHGANRLGHLAALCIAGGQTHGVRHAVQAALFHDALGAGIEADHGR